MRHHLDDLIKYLQSYYAKFNKRPSRRAWMQYSKENNYPSVPTYEDRFGGWTPALRAAGMVVRHGPPCALARARMYDSNKRNRESKRPQTEYKRVKSPNGYIYIWVPDRKQHMLEHRLVMEKVMGRRLHRHELVHHRNGVKDDNRPENLEILTRKNHHGTVECPHCLKSFLIQ